MRDAFVLHTQQGVSLLTAPNLHRPGLIHAFSTRQGGVSRPPYESLNLGKAGEDPREGILENYRRFAKAAGFVLESLVMARQIHGAHIRAVTASDCGQGLYTPVPKDCDGLMTRSSGVTLGVFSADCVPILLTDPVTKAIAAVHAGWRGTAAGMAARAVNAMREAYGTDPAHLLCAIGPSIHPCCFETDQDVPDAMRFAWRQDAQPYLHSLSPSRWKVDLQGLNRLWLTKAGVPDTSISDSGCCTCCDETLFYSHRRQGARRGSMLAVIGWR